MIVHVVEDDEAVADALAMAIKGLDHQAVTYKDGETFLQNATPSERDCVIVDLGLPGKNGAEVVHELMALTAPPNIVAISGKPRIKLVQYLHDLPELRVLRKPLSTKMLAEVLSATTA